MQRLRWVLLRSIAHPPLRFTLFLLLAYLGAREMLDQSVGMNIFHDAQFLSAYERNARISLLQYGQFPFWDPYSCGGLYGLAAPQTRYASPFFLLSLWLDVDRASALLALLLPALGMEGMYRYARSWGASPSLALLCAPIFPLSGFFAGAWRWGWVQFLSFCGVPWILFGLRRALRGERAGAYLCAISCALTVGFGGTWTLPMGALLAAFEVLDAALPPRRPQSPKAARGLGYLARCMPRIRRTLTGVAVTLVWILGIGAFRLWPMLESTAATLRVMGGEPKPDLYDLASQLFWTASGPDASNGTYYVTPLVCLTLLTLPLRRARVQWLALAFVASLCLGYIAPYAPFALLRQLPIYDTIRYPERCLVLFALSAALLAAVQGSAAVAFVRKRRRAQKSRRLWTGLCALIALGLAFQLKNAWTLSADVELEPSPVPHAASFRQSRGNRWLMSHFSAENMGSIGCGEAYPLPMSVHLRGDLKAEEYLTDKAHGMTDPSLGSVRRLAWSPNRIKLALATSREARLMINQNYHPGWRSSRGRVESWDGLLSVVVPAGEQTLEISFVPRSGVGGLWVSLASLCAGALFVLGQGWRRAYDAVALAFGPGLLAAFLALWPEQPWVHPAPRTPDGAAVLSRDLPSDARPEGAQFDVPITLQGSRLPREPLPAGSTEVSIDLFFARQGKLSPALGIFVHLSGPEKRSASADHTEISGQLYLPRIPLGQIARDSFRVPLPTGAKGTWRVRVGLWDTHGGGERRKIVDPGRAEVRKDAVLIGTFTLADP